MSRYVGFGLLLALPTFALFVALTRSTHHHREALAAYVLFLGSLALLLLVRLVDRVAAPVVPSVFEARAPRKETPKLVELEQLRRQLALAHSSSFDFQYRLRPRLMHVASTRLQRRYALDPTRDPEGARAVLGESAWALIQPDRRTRDVGEPGIPLRDLRSLIETLEQI